MESIEITYDEAVTILNELIEGREHKVYVPPVEGSAACMYLWDGKPSCLIGQLLARKGADNDFLTLCDETGGIGSIIRDERVLCDWPTARLLIEVQSLQDAGSTWGEAVRRGIAYAESIPAD